MRIVIDLQGAQSASSRNSGIGRCTLSLTQAIIRNKGQHEVIIALNGLFPDTIEPIRATLDGLLPQENIRVWYAPGPLRYFDRAGKWRRKAAELAREAFLNSLQPDVVHIMSLFEGLEDDAVTSIGLFAKNIPTTVTLYDLIPLIHRKLYLENPLVESWYQNKLDHLRRADLLLANSESSRQEGMKLLGFPQERAINVSAAADPQFCVKNISSEKEQQVRERYGLRKEFVMCGGCIDYRENAEGLIRAYATLPKSLRMQHQLAVVCSIQVETGRQLKKLAQEAGLAENEMILTGFVPEDDLIALYSLCKTFIFPSWHEGFGLPALEAMSCGAPVIASNTTSLLEVVGREDALFDPHDDHAIAERLSQVLTDRAFREGLIHHGLEQSRKFSWDQSAIRAIAAFERLHTTRPEPQQSLSVSGTRPKLAYISPLPPERSGISDYSAELLPELTRHYDIDVIVQQETITDPFIKENCSVRSADWFIGHGGLYDRVLYHFGNSPFHQHMFDLLARVPGVVVLHDFFLGHVMAHMELLGVSPNCWVLELYHSHGYRAVQERFNAADIADVIWQYPCNKTVIENALGIIVHSNNSRRLAEKWLGETSAKDWTVVPLLRSPILTTMRAEARHALGLSEDAFIVCSYGMLGPAKQNHRILDAWLSSSLSKDKRCLLLFVGENPSGSYGAGLVNAIGNSGCSDRIRVTGWVDTVQFRQYLAAADVGVQLRTLSRGETSATVLDCMKYGLSTIVNAHGSMADLPADAAWILPDDYEDVDLSKALETLWKDTEKRRAIGARAREVILTQHAPRICAGQYAQAIESYYEQARTGKAGLITAISSIEEAPAEKHEWLRLEQAIAQNRSPPVIKQLLVDVSALVEQDLKTGIQRVVRGVLKELVDNPPTGFRVEPVYGSPSEPVYRYARQFALRFLAGIKAQNSIAWVYRHARQFALRFLAGIKAQNSTVWGYRYARQFALRFLGCPDQTLLDEPVEAFTGDIFLGLDFHPYLVSQQAAFYQHLRRIGAKVYFVVHDLLPVSLPEAFPESAPAMHRAWLSTVAQADGAVCISRAVADELTEWLKVSGPGRLRPFTLGWSHHGADMQESVSSIGLPGNAGSVLSTLMSRPTFLAVGTIEPRKGYLQTIAAFEQLWAQGIDVNLVIVGYEGWKNLPATQRRTIPLIVSTLRNHPERDRRLHWLEGISDEYLEKVYAASTCLIATSEAEGFGLPLIEAAQSKLPIIARGIPVFREVAGDHAFYFCGSGPEALADSVHEWLALNKAGEAPRSDSMPWLTWKQSTQNLLNVIMGARWYRQWMPDDAHSFRGDDNRLDTQVIMKHIKTEAILQRDVNGRNTPSPPEADTILHERAVPEVRLLSLEPIHTIPAFEPKGDGYRLQDFLLYYDLKFVTHAYRGILGRTPDDHGFHHYLNKLREGKLSRVEVLGRLRYAPEGRSRRVKVKGLLPYFLVLSFLRIPVLGYLGRLAAGLLRLPALIKNLQSLDSFTHAELLALKEHVNLNTRQIQAMLNDLAGQCFASAEALGKGKADFAGLRQMLALKADRDALALKADRDELALKADRDELVLKADRDELALKADRLELGPLIADISKGMNNIASLRRTVVEQERRVWMLIEEARKRMPEPFTPEQIGSFADEGQHLLDAFYVSFEDEFRGTREEIMERLRVYLPFLEQAGVGGPDSPVLDLGCGRGEWLELLKQHDFKGIGVDINRVMLALCKEYGLEVAEGDALTFLRGQTAGSLGAVTGFHIIEHLRLKTLIQLMDEVLRALKPGGMVIFESPNPENLVTGACNFYTDPTHRNPLPPATARHLLEVRGFGRVDTLRLNPDESGMIGDGTLQRLLYGPQDYAVIGYK